MGNYVTEGWLDSLEKTYAEPKYQEEIRTVILNNPAEYRKKVETDEFREAGIKEKDGEYFLSNGQRAPKDKVDFVKRTIDKRMLTESPALQSQNLIVKGGMIVPDRKYHMKQKGKKVN